jgi:hypothetical protein
MARHGRIVLDSVKHTVELVLTDGTASPETRRSVSERFTRRHHPSPAPIRYFRPWTWPGAHRKTIAQLRETSGQDRPEQCTTDHGHPRQILDSDGVSSSR